ncbi:hypothetical protein IC620_10755 [Hazenella sp. IB182357]|uniref:Uncharacterized protein n=1 Tax=Polycladospora coralii TaxID=2771432 RepID=A0A926NBP7_9BACL|nr:hypothetical protein [Polycladospora coralii]MBD1372835.1 hypothetical protein [Polycladospora coralii]
MGIKFFYDFGAHQLIILDERGRRKVLTQTKAIDHFLGVYQLSREACKGVVEAEDRLHLFEKKQLWTKMKELFDIKRRKE